MRRVATTGMMLQFVLDNGKLPALRFRDLKERFGSGADQAGGEIGIGIQTMDALDVVNRWSATVVTDTKEAHEFIDGFFHLIGTSAGVCLHLFAPREILERDAKGQHA